MLRLLRPVSVTSIGIPPVEVRVLRRPYQLRSAAIVAGAYEREARHRTRRAAGNRISAVAVPNATIGRWDADNGVFPDVDLDAFDPEAKVSRRHARIKIQDGKYLIEDLGSTNGTYVNRGRRLIAGKPESVERRR